MVDVNAALTAVALSAVAGLLAAYRNTLILGSAILGFSCLGLGLIVGSALTTGWWQALQLAIGVSLLFVGTVELGILGLIRHVLGEDEADPQDRSSGQKLTLNKGAASITFRASNLTASQIAAISAVLDSTDESTVSTSERPSE